MNYLKVLMFALTLSVSASAQVDTNSQHFYMFFYFLNAQEEAGARIALSSDAINWQKINNETPIFTPRIGVGEQPLMRDPNSYYDSRTGIFHVVWTSGWKQDNIGYATSKDLKNWTTQLKIPVGSKIPNCACCWAPELFFDDVTDSFVVYWSTERGTNGKRGYYCMTKEFKHFTAPTLFFDPGYSVIDETILKVADNNYYMFFKDERTADEAVKQSKNIHYVTASKPQGPWSLDGPWDKVSPPITSPGMEGPSAIKIGSEYWIYFDPFLTFSSTYRMVKIADLTTTTFPWPQGPVLKTETGNFLTSHGSISEIPRAKVMQLLYGVPDPTTYEPWTVPTQDQIQVDDPPYVAPEYPIGKRNTGCGTGVGLALFPPLFFKVMSLRKRRKKPAKGD
jgi:hypothetical protein